MAASAAGATEEPMKTRCDRVRRIASIAAPGVVLPIGALSPAPSIAASCEAVAGLKIDNTMIDAAESRPAGAYTPVGGAELTGLPAFCRVHAVVSPVEGSHVGFEVWLPEAEWNGKIEMLGNGGYSSAMAFPAMGEQLKRGYAAVATDTGHKGDDPDFAAGHPEAIVDWASRAIHVSIDGAKSVASALYGQAARHAYFWGCSTGGQQALMEAQRYPKDFDGIIAGDPGNNRHADRGHVGGPPHVDFGGSLRRHRHGDVFRPDLASLSDGARRGGAGSASRIDSAPRGRDA